MNSILPKTTVDAQEIANFEAIANEWWNPNGKFKPLHAINAARVGFIREQAEAHFRGELRAKSGDEHGGIKKTTLLDIGCGGGIASESFARLGFKVTGIDASAKNLAIARDHAAKSSLEIDYRHITAEHLAEDGEKFDIVLALEIIEHVADVDLFMKSVSALIKPGGILFMSTISRTLKAYALAIVGAEYIMRWLPRGTHQWSKFLTPAELSRHMRSHGLNPQTIAGITLNPLSGEWGINPDDASVNYIMAAIL